MTRIYEDMALGNLSRERNQKMAEGYETPETGETVTAEAAYGRRKAA